MLKQISLLFLLLLPWLSFSQTYKITYKSYSNGKYQEDGDFSIYFKDNIVYLSSQNAKVQQFTDFNKKENSKIMEFENNLYRNSKPFSELLKPESIENSTETILGYKCKLAVFYSFSNKIEVWFTDKVPAYGNPYSAFIPEEKSLALKVVVNGNREIVASEIQKVKNVELPEYQYDKAVKISDSEFEEKVILSRYSRLSIFEDAQINFDTNIEQINLEDIEPDVVYHLSNGGIVLKKVRIDESFRNSYFYVELDVKSNGDAYDRTGSVFMLPDNDDFRPMLKAIFGDKSEMPVFEDKFGEKYQGMIATSNFLPQIELMRFFTSFGAGHFNTLRPINNYPWAEKITYKQEVSQLLPDDEYVWFGVFIGNYDKGGHIINLKLNFYPSFGSADENVQKFILPVFNTVNILEMSGQNYGKFFKTDTLVSEFVIPENLENPVLLYTSTGHGGWGSGDEFVPKMNKIFIDGKEIYSFIPWRYDCATYRFSNPASGNFSNGLSSSDLSRSNWCPGTLTQPEYIPLSNLTPGKHVIKVVIAQGEDEGSSFSHWSVFGCIVGEETNVNGLLSDVDALDTMVLDSGFFTDPRDNKRYKVVKIGNQIWMAENLAYKPSSGRYWAYNYDETNVATYGYLYAWNTAMNEAVSSNANPSGVQGICPSGWHLPSDAEWTQLTDYLGANAGDKLKETGTEHWIKPNVRATNESGFTALPGGGRYAYGGFFDIGYRGYWWSATEYDARIAWDRNLYHSVSSVNRYENYKESGFSVRCVKD